MSRNKNVLVTAPIIGAIVVIFALSMFLNRNAPEDEAFVGSDSLATEHIEENHSDYKPWFSPVFTPGSGEIESGLFALQAALGAGVFGFALGAMWQRRRSEREAIAPAGDVDAMAARAGEGDRT